MEHKEYLDAENSLKSNNIQDIHLSLEQRRKKFMDRMKDNKLF